MKNGKKDGSETNLVKEGKKHGRIEVGYEIGREGKRAGNGEDGVVVNGCTGLLLNC